MERKIIYLINPASGRSKKAKVVRKIHAATTVAGVSFQIIFINAGFSYEEIKDKIIDDVITDVVVVGGDGTVNRAINAFRGLPIVFGIIPMGSGNGLARAVNIPTNPYSALRLILSKGEPAWVDAFFINDYFSCMLSGIGFDAEVANRFATQAVRGVFSYTQQSIFNYFKTQPYQFEIVLDNFSFFSDAFFISIANANQFGNNVTIAPKARMNDGLLDVVVVQRMSKWRLPFAIWHQIRGNNKLQQLANDIGKENIIYFQTSSLRIENLKLAPLHIDGDPMPTAQSLQIKIIPKCFLLIQPK